MYRGFDCGSMHPSPQGIRDREGVARDVVVLASAVQAGDGHHFVSSVISSIQLIEIQVFCSLLGTGNVLSWPRFLREFPWYTLANICSDMGATLEFW